MAKFDLVEARCQLCFQPLALSEKFIAVYMSPGEVPGNEINLSDHRSGFIHLIHLQRIFDPMNITVTEDQYAMGPANSRVRIQIGL